MDLTYTSPNFDERNTSVSAVVLHYTDMLSAKEALDRLCDPTSQVSAHYLVDVDGTIYSLVPEEKRAWHAGKSSWMGIPHVNHFSIGIEIQNGGVEFFKKNAYWEPYSEIQIKSVLDLLKTLKKRYDLGRHQILGHCHVAPDRKIDPGPHFPWSSLMRQLFHA